MSRNNHMHVVTVHLPESYIEVLDDMVRRRLYPSRAEAIRMAVRDLLMSEGTILEFLKNREVNHE